MNQTPLPKLVWQPGARSPGVVAVRVLWMNARPLVRATAPAHRSLAGVSGVVWT